MLCNSFLVCIFLGLFLQLGARMSKKDEKMMLMLHNKARQDLMDCNIPGQPAAKRMPPLIWDSELAAKAQVWSDQCVVGHDLKKDRATTRFPKVGQNWAGAKTLNVAFQGWFMEYHFYGYRNLSCTKKCGHYTAIIDVRSTHVGCAKSRCRQQNWHTAWVCNYGPAGNMRFMDSSGNISPMRPYEKSNKCNKQSE